jgi:hypothetical protein
MVTSRTITTLLARLGAAADATAVLRELADADLPRDNAIYQVHMTSAGALATALEGLNWTVLDDIAARADDAGQPEAATVVAGLRDAARRDEHAIALAPQLGEADRAALALVMQWTRKPDSDSERTGKSDAGQDRGPRRRPARWVRGRDIAAVLAEIHADAEANPDAEFEITWQVVERSAGHRGDDPPSTPRNGG